MDVVVAGGGLAGLVAARRLADAGAEVRLVERESTVGGRVRSVRREGYTFDRGFQVLLDAYPAAREELDYGALDLRAFAPGAVIARPNRRSVLADPLRDPWALTETLFNREVTLGDKLRTLRLRRELAAVPDDALDRFDARSSEAFLRDRGFSARFIERFAAPFYGGITLDRSLGTSAFVLAATWRALAAGRAVVPAAGMGAIPDQLAGAAGAAGAEVETGRTVEAVSSDDDGNGVTVTVDGDAVEADAAVVATDPPTARDLTGVGSIPTAGRGCVTQYYALRGGDPLDAGRRIVLNAGGERPNLVVPVSAVAPTHAPRDVLLLSATFLGDRDAPEGTLAAWTREALESWYPERTFAGLDPVHTARVDFAQVAQPPGFRAALPDVREPEGPVYLAGDYTRWSSIQGALESGRRAARAVLADR